MKMQPFIDIQHMTYTYPAQRVGGTVASPVLRDVNLQIQEGEYVVLLGHNGSGKSTLARHCNALLLPDQGRVLVAGMDTSDVASQPAIRESVGMIFQNPDNQLIATVVEDDVAWSLTVLGYPADEIRRRVAEALNVVGITSLRGLPPHKLSGGQRQRVAIAGILALRPRCIIADEATSMLDPVSRQELGALFARLNREFGITIIQVTHLLDEAAYAQRVILMERGQVIQQGTTAQIFSDLERLRELKLVVPDSFVLAARLRDAGFQIAENAMTIEKIAREVAGE